MWTKGLSSTVNQKEKGGGGGGEKMWCQAVSGSEDVKHYLYSTAIMIYLTHSIAESIERVNLRKMVDKGPFNFFDT